jgi:hypothetical protein
MAEGMNFSASDALGIGVASAAYQTDFGRNIALGMICLTCISISALMISGANSKARRATKKMRQRKSDCDKFIKGSYASSRAKERKRP